MEFEDNNTKSEALFEEGKKALSNADYVTATLSFTNALYKNDREPEYAYYLSRSLFEDTSESGRKGRLGSSKKFLEYALSLDPNHQKAKELLVSVNGKIREIDTAKKS